MSGITPTSLSSLKEKLWMQLPGTLAMWDPEQLLRDVRSENRNRVRSPDLGLMKNMQQCTFYVFVKMIGCLIIRI